MPPAARVAKATIAKNTLKAGCRCDLALVPRVNRSGFSWNRACLSAMAWFCKAKQSYVSQAVTPWTLDCECLRGTLLKASGDGGMPVSRPWRTFGFHDGV